jgi:hypothetical protein
MRNRSASILAQAIRRRKDALENERYSASTESSLVYAAARASAMLSYSCSDSVGRSTHIV